MKTLSLSSRARLARPSPTLTITAKANALRAQGLDVIGFGAGEPDFNTPEPICEAAIKALREGFTKYTSTPGIPALREAIAEKLVKENGIEVTAENIVVCCGGKHALFNAMTAVVDPGDEVIVMTPYWATYADQIALSGGSMVEVKCSANRNFEPDPADVRAAITGKTRAIVLNSPNNPTGAVYSRETLSAIAELAVEHEIWLVCDEIYEQLVYDGEHVSIASLNPRICSHTITIGGCSKTFAMTGWRIGYVAAPTNVAKAISAIQDAVTSNATSFAQKGAIEAMRMDDQSVSSMRAEFRQRRDLMRSELAKVPGLITPNPMGAFYFFVDMSPFLKKSVGTDEELAGHLLEEALLATVPGSVFGAPGFLRLSYTASQENIVRGTARLSEALQKLL